MRPHPPMQHPNTLIIPRHRAFTLVELLTVIAIVGVLAGIIIPVVNSVRGSALRSRCMSNIRQISIATLLLTTQDNKGKYPAMRVFSWEGNSTFTYLGATLRPYLALNLSSTGQYDQIFRCPTLEARGKNGGAADFLVEENNQYSHYRYNTLTAPGAVNPPNPAKAVLLFETVWPNWQAQSWAHEPKGATFMHVGYADGHVATMTYATYVSLSGGAETAGNNFFSTGWKN